MPSQTFYQPALNYLRNRAEALAIELERLQHEQHQSQQRLNLARSRRLELARELQAQATGPLQADAAPTLRRDLLMLDQAILKDEQALSDLRHRIDDQSMRVLAARQELERFLNDQTPVTLPPEAAGSTVAERPFDPGPQAHAG